MHRGLSAAAGLGHVLVSPWEWEVSVNIPCPLTVFLRCFLLLLSPVPVPSCWLSHSWASQLSHTTDTTHESRNSGCPTSLAAVPVPVSVQAAPILPPVMPHETSLGAQKCGLPLKPTASRLVQTPATSTSLQQCHVSPTRASYVRQTEFRFTSHPHLQTMSQCTHSCHLPAASWSQWRGEACPVLPKSGGHLLPTAKTEPELHRAMEEGKSKQNLLLIYCVWSAWQCCTLCTWQLPGESTGRG